MNILKYTEKRFLVCTDTIERVSVTFRRLFPKKMISDTHEKEINKLTTVVNLIHPSLCSQSKIKPDITQCQLNTLTDNNDNIRTRNR